MNCARFVLGIALAMSQMIVHLTVADDSAKPVDLTTLSLYQLAARLDLAPRDRYESQRHRVASFEAILCEMIRRGGAAEKVLAARLAAPDAKLKAAREAFEQLEDGSDEKSTQERLVEALQRNLELITALCRVQGKPDPLAVIVDHPEELKAGTRESPVLEISLKNVGRDKRDIGLAHGGDYRSGRHDRWRVHVWDSKGHLLTELPRASSIGGGWCREGPLPFGETWEAQLALESYVRIRSPGKYKVQLLYHNSELIADVQDATLFDEMIVFRSEPFELTVEHGPTTPIRLNADLKNKARALVKALEPDDPLRILIGKYDKEAHDFIDPTSPQGQLLAMEWKAVPALLEALEDETLSFRKRAWISSLLFSITLERDLTPLPKSDEFPRPSGLLPDYETRGSLATSVTWKGGSSLGWTPGGKSKGGREDLAAQRGLAKEWLRFRKEYLEIQIEK